MKVLDVIVKTIESSMCYVGVIGVYLLVLVGRFIGSVNTSFHVINLILYIFYGYLKDINVFFWSGNPGVPVDE